MIYTVTISPAIDYVMHLNKMTAGATNRSASEEYYFGGKGINVSVMLRNLGIESVALGFVAGFTGKALEEGLAGQGIKTDFVHLDKGITRINVKIKSDQETEINGQGAIPEMKDFDVLADKLEHLQSGDILVISGTIPKRLPDDTYDRLLTVASDKDVMAVVDTSGELLLSTLRHRPFLIKPNIDELKDLFGSDIEPLEGAQKLHAAGARNVIVSLGGKGAMLLAENGEAHYCGVPSGKVLNTVGSGDSMVAGFLAGYTETGDYQKALELGGAAGSATAFTPGLAARETIDRCLSEIVNQ
jgi:1-phosphofructokinase